MTYRPIKDDPRYTIDREWCGYPQPRYVLRFCGDWIAQSISRSSMATRAVGEATMREARLRGECAAILGVEA